MAVIWRCPGCGEAVGESDPTLSVSHLVCHHCGEIYLQRETLCVVCDAPNPWSARDSLHFWCRVCGNTQTWLSHRPAVETDEGMTGWS